ncbi:plasmid mobilization protein [Limnothrix redekei]|uniref:plasmid mobilization protein n=1 Tax=Limnothrix redekei TaxID=132606 RepID=UPI0037205CCF
MARDKVFRVRLTKQELEKLERNAQEQGISSAELIRDYIKRLPNLLDSGTSSPVILCGESMHPGADPTGTARNL